MTRKKGERLNIEEKAISQNFSIPLWMCRRLDEEIGSGNKSKLIRDLLADHWSAVDAKAAEYEISRSKFEDMKKRAVPFTEA